ncbi:hypothetical protein PAECIP111802_00872 [Paenibacillus allorhizosphaerae]|uniref:Uncharacterized protein n=1 Tax=Paenibacillus allorhizosphaerae TaxID=2849866 RepID=A0ABM8VC24_9BACL|nr:hypothetical protein PAECIP111802_00872 [Paenibacillus allorhizosphaerae]
MFMMGRRDRRPAYFRKTLLRPLLPGMNGGV